jgi:hypothetical protein
MPSVLYVALQEADRIAAFAINEAGKLTKQGEVPAPGGPAVMAVSPDRTGRFMLVAYYQGGGAAVFRLAGDATVGAPSQDWLATATGADAIATDRSNRFGYVPPIARIQDNMLEPPKNIPGPNTIMQFRLDAEGGGLSPNVPPQVKQADLAGPRHYCFRPSLDLAYFSNQQGCSVTSYRINPSNGALTALQTISTLPAGFDARNTCSQIHLPCPAGSFTLAIAAITASRVPRRAGHRFPDADRPCGDRSDAKRLLPRPRWQVPVCRRYCDRSAGVLPNCWRQRCVDPTHLRGSRSVARRGDNGPSRQLTRAGYRYRHSKTAEATSNG